MSGGRRRQLVALADRYNVPILEDEFVGDLRYDGRAQPALKALDPGGRVFYMGTFSKMLMPGLRVGYVVIDGPVYERLVDWKHIHDLATSNLIQRALEAYISVGRYQTHLNRARRIYRQRRDAMLAALEQHLPPDTHWIPAQGGFFIWVRLPDEIPAQELLSLATKEKVNFSPGCMFYPGEKEHSYLRLNFAMNPPEAIDEGIHRLGRAVQRYRSLQ
jgi:GntR family transcriptional regulator/MocR family aminotransferase